MALAAKATSSKDDERTPFLTEHTAPLDYGSRRGADQQTFTNTTTDKGPSPRASLTRIIEDDAELAGDSMPPISQPQSLYRGDISRRQFWVIYAGILFQYFVTTFDSTLMASAHPVITSYFDASNSASWLSTSFMLTTTAFQPLFGRVSDTFGRRPLYLFALCMFLVTTAWCALAQSIGSFIAARAFCGLGAGGVMAMVRLFADVQLFLTHADRARSLQTTLSR